MDFSTVGNIIIDRRITALGVSVAQSLDNLAYDIEDAAQNLHTLSDQLDAFTEALRNFQEAERESKPSTLQNGRFSLQREDTITGGYAVIQMLEQDLKNIGFTGLHRDGTKDIRLDSEMKAKLLNRFNDAYVKKWGGILHRHTTVLILLLKSYRRMEQSATTEGSNGDIYNEIDRHQIDKQIAEAEPLHSYHIKKAESVKESAAPDHDDHFNGQGSKATDVAESVTGWETMRSRLDGEQLQMSTGAVEDFITNFSKLRVFLLGRKGAGKSTLSSFVLGLPGDSFHQEPTQVDAIWNPLPEGSLNKLFEIHDSSGIEPDVLETSEEMAQARAFIQSKQSVKLGDQMHALWYLIDCSADQPLHESDKDFLSGKLLETKEIPIFVVFMKYDMLVDNIRKKTASDTADEDVEKQAEIYFKSKVEVEVLKLVPDRSKLSLCRVGLVGNSEEFAPINQTNDDLFGTKALVKLVERRLRKVDLRILSIAMQQRHDKQRILESLKVDGMRAFWRSRIVAKTSFLTFICIVGIESIFQTAEKQSLEFWKIPNWKKSDKLVQAILTRKDFHLYPQMILCFNVFGSFSLRRVTKLALHFLISVNILGNRLSQLQAQHDRDLTEEEVTNTITNFSTSGEKDEISRAVGLKVADLVKINRKADDRDQKVLDITEDVLDEVLKYADASFFQRERLRLLESV